MHRRPSTQGGEHRGWITRQNITGLRYHKRRFAKETLIEPFAAADLVPSPQSKQLGTQNCSRFLLLNRRSAQTACKLPSIPSVPCGKSKSLSPCLSRKNVNAKGRQVRRRDHQPSGMVELVQYGKVSYHARGTVCPC